MLCGGVEIMSHLWHALRPSGSHEANYPGTFIVSSNEKRYDRSPRVCAEMIPQTKVTPGGLRALWYVEYRKAIRG